MELLKCDNLAVSYDSNPILHDISFDVNAGDYLCIVGENGSGKSTLIKALLGLIKLKKGNLTFCNGLDRRDIGYLPQSNEIQRDFPASVKEVVLSGTLNKMGLSPFYNAECKKIANDNIKLLGLTDIKNKCFNELSGGQMQRVLLARALCASKKILLLDEPTSALDAKITNDLYSIIQTLNEEQGITIIMVTHDLKTALKYANKILHLSHDSFFFGTKEEYKSDKLSEFLIPTTEEMI